MRVLSWLSFVLSAVGRAAVVEPGLMSVVDKVVGVGRNCDIYFLSCGGFLFLQEVSVQTGVIISFFM